MLDVEGGGAWEGGGGQGGLVGGWGGGQGGLVGGGYHPVDHAYSNTVISCYNQPIIDGYPANFFNKIITM